MADLRGLLLGLIVTSFITMTWQQYSFSRKFENVDVTAVTSNISVALTWGFGDLMAVVCRRYCWGNDSHRVCEGDPQVCLGCQCDSDCGLYGDCCPYPEGRLGKVNGGGAEGVSGGAVSGGSLQQSREPLASEDSVFDSNQRSTTDSPMDEGTVSLNSSEVDWFTDKKTTMFDCVIIDTLSDYGVFMLRKCQPDFDDPNVKHLCESDVRLDKPMPVTSMGNRHTFYNQFCAICNQDTNLSYWVRGSFQVNSSLTVPSGVSVRFCDGRRSREVVSTCNVTGLWQEYDADLEDRCHSLYYPVSHRGLIFQNFYCLLCNGGLDAEFNCSGIFTDVKAVVSQTLDSDVNILVAFLPNRTSDYTPRFKCRKRPDCQEGFWLDPFSVKCRQLLCNAGRKLVNGNCVLINPETQPTKYHARLLLTPKFNTTLVNLAKLIEENYDYLSAEFLADNIKMVISEVRPNIAKNRYIMDTYFFVNRGEMEDAEVFLMKFVNSEWKFTHRGVNQTILSTIAGSLDWLLASNMLPLSLAAVPGSSRFFPVSEHFELMDFKQYTVVEKSEFVSLTQHTLCPHVHIYRFGIRNTGMVEVIYENVSFDMTRVTQQDHYLAVCTELLESLFNETQEAEEVEVTMEARVTAGLSIFCTSLSLLCLLITICTYCTFSALRSQPGWNNLMLAVALFSAQLTLMFSSLSSAYPAGCRAYGVVLHFLWLAAVMWMNVCSFHMFRTFTNSMRVATDSVSFLLLTKYVVFAFGMPSAIVLITLGTSLGLSGGSEIGYGGRACYLSSHLLVGLAFALPLSLVLVSNLVFFVLTVRSIAATKQLHRDVESQRTYVYMYVKLSSLTGFFWTVALLAQVTGVQCLLLLSVILNSSQGVFIFFSFIFNKKVLRLWSSLVRRSSPSTSSSHFSNSRDTHSSQV